MPDEVLVIIVDVLNVVVLKIVLVEVVVLEVVVIGMATRMTLKVALGLVFLTEMSMFNVVPLIAMVACPLASFPLFVLLGE
jgi:hypothetical protein